MGRALALIFTLWIVLNASPVAADPESEAQALFQQGVELIEVGDKEQAAELFAEALAIFPHPPIANNLAFVLGELNRHAEALEVLDGLLAESYGALSPEQAAETEASRQQTLSQLGTLVVVARGASIAVQINDLPLSQLEEGVERTLRLDPGTHRIVAVHQGEEIMSRTVDLAAEQTVRVVAAPAPPARDLNLRHVLHQEPAAPVDSDEDSGVSGWWWVLGSAAVLAAAGVVAFLLLSPESESLVEDPVFGISFTLR